MSGSQAKNATEAMGSKISGVGSRAGGVFSVPARVLVNALLGEVLRAVLIE